jgi:L-threonine kinase
MTHTIPIRADKSIELEQEEMPAGPVMIANRGVGYAYGTFGEILQGRLPEGQDFLVTLPIEAYSRARFSTAAQTHHCVSVFPHYKQKSLRLLEALLRRRGLRPQGRLDITSDIPEGKGLASSSADMVATARAVSDAYKVNIACWELEECLRQIEPTDGVMYPGVVCYLHREVRLMEHLGTLPRFLILAIDEGGEIDTVEFNRVPAQYSTEQCQEYLSLLNRLRTAITVGDCAAIGTIATRSAMLNEHRNPKRHLREVIDIATAASACGTVVSHSGTYLGVLIDAEDQDRTTKSLSVEMELQALNKRVYLFRSWDRPVDRRRDVVGWSASCVSEWQMLYPQVVMPPSAKRLILPRAEEVSGSADAAQARTRSR